MFLSPIFPMKKILAPLAFATLLLSACSTASVLPADDGMEASSSSAAVEGMTDESSVEVKVEEGSMEATVEAVAE